MIKRKEYFNENGELIKIETPYINEKKHGVEKRYKKNGVLIMESPFVDGKKHGIEKINISSDDILTSVEISYIKGEIHGRIKGYNDDVLFMDSAYLHGKKHGMTRIYNDKGLLVKEIEYKKGKIDGTTKDFDNSPT